MLFSAPMKKAPQVDVRSESPSSIVLASFAKVLEKVETRMKTAQKSLGMPSKGVSQVCRRLAVEPLVARSGFAGSFANF